MSEPEKIDTIITRAMNAAQQRYDAKMRNKKRGRSKTPWGYKKKGAA